MLKCFSDKHGQRQQRTSLQLFLLMIECKHVKDFRELGVKGSD